MGDLYSNNASLLIHADTVGGSTAFYDSSHKKNIVTAYGNAAISNVQSKWGQGAGYFYGTGDYLGASSSSLLIGSNDFMVQAWIYVLSLAGGKTIASSRLNSSGSANYWAFSVLNDGALDIQSRNSSGTQFRARSAVGAITTNQWYFVTCTRVSGILSVFIGDTVGPITANDESNNLIENTVAVGIFNYPNFVNYFNGYIQDFRFVNGVYWDANAPTARLPDPDPVTGRLLSPTLRRDIEDGGSLAIIEPVTRLNSPVQRRVRLCDQVSGRVVREAWSDPVTGDVTFAALREGPWALYSLDHTGEFEAVAIADRLATIDGSRP